MMDEAFRDSRQEENSLQRTKQTRSRMKMDGLKIFWATKLDIQYLDMQANACIEIPARVAGRSPLAISTLSS